MQITHDTLIESLVAYANADRSAPRKATFNGKRVHVYYVLPAANMTNPAFPTIGTLHIASIHGGVYTIGDIIADNAAHPSMLEIVYT